jgi:glycosyltransferase involved in cell wall biosynthesis
LLAFYGRPYVDQLRERMTPATAERIEITGMVSREDLIGHYQWADLLAMPSIYPEGFSIPIVEAAACRVPAVVTRRGGMPEVVDDGKTGLIVPPADADALANALLELLDDPARRQRMGQAAYERAIRNFTWDRVA